MTTRLLSLGAIDESHRLLAVDARIDEELRVLDASIDELERAKQQARVLHRLDKSECTRVLLELELKILQQKHELSLLQMQTRKRMLAQTERALLLLQPQAQTDRERSRLEEAWPAKLLRLLNNAKESVISFLTRRLAASLGLRRVEGSKPQPSAAVNNCGACERELPKDCYSDEQWTMSGSTRRCEECVAKGGQLVLMKKGIVRPDCDNCHICTLPMPLQRDQSMFQVCCMKKICDGCNFASVVHGIDDLCFFCKTSRTVNESEQVIAMIQERVEAGDPMATYCLGTIYCTGGIDLPEGRLVFEKDLTRGIEVLERAAEGGVTEAHFQLGLRLCHEDKAKATKHYESAAMKGHVQARYYLGFAEYQAGNYSLALQHLLISAKLGHEESLNKVRDLCQDGRATRANYGEALKGYMNAVEEMSSSNRDQARAYYNKTGESRRC